MAASQNFLRRLGAILIAAACAAPAIDGVAFAGSIHTDASPAAVALGNNQSIDRFGVCRNVANTANGDAVMVPVRDGAEWSSGKEAFLSEPREGTAVTDCAGLNGWTTPAATYVTSFRCPDTHSRQFCGSFYSKTWSDDAGSRIFALATNDSGQQTPITYIMKNDMGTISEVGRNPGTKYKQPTSGLAVTADGSAFAQWDRRYTDSSAWPKIALYSFDGTTVTELAKTNLSGPGAYVSPAVTDDAKFVAADGVIFTPQAGVLTPVTVSGPQIHVNDKGTGSIVDTVWNQENNAFYEFSAKYGLFEAKRQSDDSWVRTKIETSSAAGNSYMGLSVSKDGSTLVYARSGSFKDKSVPFRVFKRDASGQMVFAGQANYGVQKKDIVSQGYFRFSLSANDGKFLLFSDRSGRVIFYDTAEIANGRFVSDGAVQPVNNFSTSKQANAAFEAVALPSGLMVIRYWQDTRGIFEIWKMQ